MKLTKIVLGSLAGLFVACTISVGAMAAEEVFNGQDIWNYGTTWYTNTTYSEYKTDRCYHGSEAWGNGYDKKHAHAGSFSDARVAIGQNNGWYKWDGQR